MSSRAAPPPCRRRQGDRHEIAADQPSYDRRREAGVRMVDVQVVEELVVLEVVEEEAVEEAVEEMRMGVA